MDHPRLRPVEAFLVEHDGQPLVGLRDQAGFAKGVVLMHQEALRIIGMFDGEHSIADIQEAHMRRTGQLLPGDAVGKLIAKLDECYLLDSDRFREHYRQLVEDFRDAEVRQASHAGGAYPAQADEAEPFFSDLLTRDGGPGVPPEEPTDDTLAALVAPHIDFHRGGAAFARAYYELASHCQAEVFIVFGTAHGPTSRRFALTRKHFDTPLGRVRTATDLVDRVADALEGDPFADEIAHRQEHSIEFQAVFLQHLLGRQRPFTIVPILVGSFHDLTATGTPPIDDPEVRVLVDAVTAASEGLDRPPCLVAGADLAHVGLRFGDTRPLEDVDLQRVRSQDHDLLEAVSRADAAGLADAIVAQQDRNRVCGYPCTYTMLQILGRLCSEPPTGKLLCYDQAVDDDRSNCVSFAAMGFHR